MNKYVKLIFNFFIEKYLEYRTIILIPENNDKLKQIFIANKIFNDEEQIEDDYEETEAMKDKKIPKSIIISEIKMINLILVF